MKRLHIHMSVDDLQKSIGFYSTLFGAEPVKQKPDYAKWMLEDPRINFAISARGAPLGVDHLGIQVDHPEELQNLRDNLKRADLNLFDEGAVTCCYAKGDKSWVQDPSGVAWEAYHTMGDAEFFHEASPKEKTEEATSCCAPATAAVETKTVQSSCC